MLPLAALGAAHTIPVGLVGWGALALLPLAYVTGVGHDRTVAWGTTLVAGAVFVAGAAWVSDRWWTGLAPTALAALVAGVAVGDAVRARRELVAALSEQASRERQALAEEHRRQSAEERLRIARDVHDLIAQHVAVAHVQAEVAGRLLPREPERAAGALRHARAASQATLEQLGALFGLLRATADAPAEPGLAHLDQLVASVPAVGLRVQRRILGQPTPLPGPVDAAGCRIVREALANAARYGDGPARLTLEYQPGRLRIEVRNGLGPARTGSTGHGLLGAGEQAAAVGGRLRAGPVGAEFVLLVELPTEEGAR